MDIAETIYQHAKQLPIDKALEVLQFITSLETQSASSISNQSTNDMREFLQTLPVTNARSDDEINRAFQALRDEWQ